MFQSECVLKGEWIKESVCFKDSVLGSGDLESVLDCVLERVCFRESVLKSVCFKERVFLETVFSGVCFRVFFKGRVF